MNRLPILLLAAVAGCGYESTPYANVRVEPWLEADALFQGDARWLGGNSASSVDLGNERTLWLFSLSSIDPTGTADPGRAVYVANTLGVQTGRNPANASIAFNWGGTDAEPDAFFPDEGDAHLSPLDGLRTGDTLTLFYARRRGIFPTEELGTVVFRISNPDAAPADWVVSRLTPPDLELDASIGVSVVHEGPFVFAFALLHDGGHRTYLLRWREADFQAGDLSLYEWWGGGARGWTPAGPPAALFGDAGSEFTVALDGARERYVQVQPLGYHGSFAAQTVGVRFADRLEGAWTGRRHAYRPPETSEPDTFVNTSKGHPQLEGAELVLTYTIVRPDPTAVVVPRFARLSFRD